jgi:uncharacterized membrane protein YgcG
VSIRERNTGADLARRSTKAQHVYHDPTASFTLPNAKTLEMIPQPDDHDSFPNGFVLACPETLEVQYNVGYDCPIDDFFDASKPGLDTWFWSSFARPIEDAERLQHFHPKGQSDGKLNLLERLPTELIDGIIDILLTNVDENVYAKEAVLCLGLSSPILYPTILSRIHRDYDRSPAPSWIGQKVGFHGLLSHYPSRVAARYKETNVHFTSDHSSWKDGSRPEEYWRHATSYIESHIAPDMPAEQMFAVRRDLSQMYMYPQNEPWVLRNLTTRQYVRSDNLIPPSSVADPFLLLPPPKSRLIKKVWRKCAPRKPTPQDLLVEEHRTKATTEPLTLPQIFLVMTMYSTFNHYLHEFFMSYGPWNAHAFDLIPLSQLPHLTSHADPEWTDVTLPVVSDIGHLRWCIWRASALYARKDEAGFSNDCTNFSWRLSESRRKWNEKLWEDLGLVEEKERQHIERVGPRSEGASTGWSGVTSGGGGGGGGGGADGGCD